MVVTLCDWVFDVDMEATMDYSAREAKDHCTCSYCRNFYAAVEDTYPELRPFLAQFGVDIEAPDEMMPFDAYTYAAYYAVSGQVLQQGGSPIMAGQLSILIESAQEAMVNTDIQAPYFFLYAPLMHFPWVLEEPAEEAVSPANLPDFLKKMWNKLLGRAEDTPRS